MLTALAEAGCQRYYPQIMGQDLADFEIIVDAFEG
jgi:hypothetical protein